MAQHKSARKRIRSNERRRIVNRSRVSRVRGALKAVESALETGDKPAAEAAFREAQPTLMRGVTKGVMHKNQMQRKLSRLSSRIRAL